jgi:hypothetical protein
VRCSRCRAAEPGSRGRRTSFDRSRRGPYKSGAARTPGRPAQEPTIRSPP